MGIFKVRYAPMFAEYINKHPEVHDKLQEFIMAKKKNPTQPYGGSDTQFVKSGPIGMTGLKLKHAHLTQDISVVYNIHGKNPHVIDMYGVMTHRELGTGTTPSKKQQKKIARKLKKQKFS